MFGEWRTPSTNQDIAKVLGYGQPFGYGSLTFKNWRGSEPDGCCGAEVACAFVNYAGTFQWDDAGCLQHWTGKTGVVCQRYEYQPIF
ncbi:unnamed protein product [Gongylonema pulchrum]|uniref:C-type lectin domain-containing protein n=1 Tax=Gongylonema pulchrum TaxID=637853 RepID=A0A183E8G2_9BILA|nr:unnamed protein product [Gongylonema pulchrum]